MILHCKNILGWRQPGQMRWILLCYVMLYIMPLVQDRSRDLLTSSPVCYHCTMATSSRRIKPLKITACTPVNFSLVMWCTKQHTNKQDQTMEHSPVQYIVGVMSLVAYGAAQVPESWFPQTRQCLHAVQERENHVQVLKKIAQRFNTYQ